MNLKRTLQIEKARPGTDNGDMALLAWKIIGSVAGFVIVASIVAMIPEMHRYLKLKSM
ncbi:MAG: hypothetical protein ACR2FX_08465 [Chthoniobacterales bacterium]